MLEFFKKWISDVWAQIKQGNPLQAFKAFFGFSTKSHHIVAKPENLELPSITTPRALTTETLMEVQAGIAASKEAMQAKGKAAIAKRKGTRWKPQFGTITEETKRQVGAENSAAREYAQKLQEKAKTATPTEMMAQLVASVAPTPKTKEEQSREDKAKDAAHKKELQERSKAAAQAKKASKEKPIKVTKVKLTDGEAQNVASILPVLTMMSFATAGEQVEPVKEVKVKKPKVAKPKREGYAKKEMARRNQTQSKGKNKHR